MTPATLAVLDPEFAETVARRPHITGDLQACLARRLDAVMRQVTIAHVRHAETRVMLALWLQADRWGHTSSAGVVCPVPLTHGLLGRLTCLQRPTVSTAVSRLIADERLRRRPDGSWLLLGGRPQTATSPTSPEVLSARR
ncbi:Crp/Fnr family transcriptional regulator [Baekduia soli]|uniref:Crp/Fnr family transcriptional regulator n=1 Tax=Baekduia soli TaxID=496014 RepID=A0A5B8U6C7_9ACTN|nr:Crp/Fnr family transcriptional regulator [Baekduia soli]QEC48212.1 Crp/Fnr family transcriptional regulator [Baekduia soli]